MTDHTSNPGATQRDTEIPEDLVADLETLYAHEPADTDALDQRVLAHAEATLNQPAPTFSFRTHRLRIGGGIAAAAGLALAIYAILPSAQPTPERNATTREAMPEMASADESPTSIDSLRGGLDAEPAATPARARVATAKPDIVDAYRLALLIESGDPIAASLDETGDGIVDQADVDALIAQAVDLETSS